METDESFMHFARAEVVPHRGTAFFFLIFLPDAGEPVILTSRRDGIFLMLT